MKASMKKNSSGRRGDTVRGGSMKQVKRKPVQVDSDDETDSFDRVSSVQVDATVTLPPVEVPDLPKESNRKQKSH